MQKLELLSLSSEYLARIDRLKKEDILPLREVIREHNMLYYQEEAPIISDIEYDALFHALARLESDHNMIDEASPTARLAILASGQFKKVRHLYPMISLDNTYNVEEVREWNDRMMRILTKPPHPLTPSPSEKGDETNDTFSKTLSPLGEGWGEVVYYVQPKYDGLGLALIYENGKLKQAITRGSGIEGEDVTMGAFEIGNIPKKIEALKDVQRMEVRGEVMMSRTTFKKVNTERLEAGEKLFANPRNAASGSLRQLDPLITRSRNLEFFAYSIPSIETSPQPSPKGEGVSKLLFSEGEGAGGGGTYHSLMNLLYSWGFEKADFPFSRVEGIENLCNLIQAETKNRKEYFDFDIDGMVLKLDTMTLWKKLGTTEHHPRYAIAYKFPAKQVRTRVVSIEHSVGRTGIVTPVANLEPVEVTGVIVKRATLHNYDELAKKDVREGDYVYIIRAGEVIPEVISVISEVRTGEEKIIRPPEVCPICQTELDQDAGKVAIFCPNRHCPAQIQGRLEVFVGKQGLNIDGLGTKQIELFLEKGWITDFASIFHLIEKKEELLIVEGYKEKSVGNLFGAIENSRHTSLARALVALGIPNIGKKTAKVIASEVSRQKDKTNKDLLHILFSLTEEELLSIKDVGPETAHAFVEYMEENREIVERLFTELDILEPENVSIENKNSKLSGKSFCVTGSFEGISRDEIHELIEKNGGEVRSSVSSKLDYLIVGSEAGSKLDKAKEVGVIILSIEEFQEMLSEE